LSRIWWSSERLSEPERTPILAILTTPSAPVASRLGPQGKLLSDATANVATLTTAHARTTRRNSEDRSCRGCFLGGRSRAQAGDVGVIVALADLRLDQRQPLGVTHSLEILRLMRRRATVLRPPSDGVTGRGLTASRSSGPLSPCCRRAGRHARRRWSPRP
jgi:hypothetical protein